MELLMLSGGAGGRGVCKGYEAASVHWIGYVLGAQWGGDNGDGGAGCSVGALHGGELVHSGRMGYHICGSAGG